MAEKEVRAKKSRKTTNKVRVKLPGIESYEKELEFTAEGPGRVVVRLERLMGSDRIRITDPKYLAILVERLEEEEAQGWVTRRRLRKKAEKNRSRQLAIEGLMEPASDMQDLWNHPVFRVNRILNRLALFDQNIPHAAGTLHKLPPIHPVEIFADDETGSIFKSYPGHRVFAHEETLEENQTEQPSQQALPRMSVATAGSGSGKDKPDRVSNVKKSLPRGKIIEGDDEEEEEEEEGDEEEAAGEEEEEGNAEDEEGEANENEGRAVVASRPGAGGTEGAAAGTSLQEMQRIYGVEPDENLVRDWEAYKSHLVDMVYEEKGDGDDLYYLGYEVNGVYTRQQDTADDFMTARNRQIAEEEKIMLAEQPSTSNTAVQPQKAEGGDAEEGEDGEGADDE